MSRDLFGVACEICGGPEASETKKPLNGLPVGVVACDLCREAVKRRDLGVSHRKQPALVIVGTDGRGQSHPMPGRAELMACIRDLREALEACAHSNDGWPETRIADVFEVSRKLVPDDLLAERRTA